MIECSFFSSPLEDCCLTGLVPFLRSLFFLLLSLSFHVPSLLRHAFNPLEQNCPLRFWVSSCLPQKIGRLIGARRIPGMSASSILPSLPFLFLFVSLTDTTFCAMRLQVNVSRFFSTFPFTFPGNRATNMFYLKPPSPPSLLKKDLLVADSAPRLDFFPSRQVNGWLVSAHLIAGFPRRLEANDPLFKFLHLSSPTPYPRHIFRSYADGEFSLANKVSSSWACRCGRYPRQLDVI